MYTFMKPSKLLSCTSLVMTNDEMFPGPELNLTSMYCFLCLYVSTGLNIRVVIVVIQRQTGGSWEGSGDGSLYGPRRL